MLHHDDLALRKLVAQSHVKFGLRPARKRTHNGDAIHFIARDAGQTQALRDGTLRASRPASIRASLFPLRRRLELAIFKNCASRVAQQTA